jgi:hypothetical protein
MQYPMIAQPQYAFAPTMMAKGGAVDAENVRAQGRNNDSMLVHMTPREVGGLQALAMQHGGSLTINPKTGLPEAGFLEDLLPTLAGAALVIGSGGAIDPFTASMIVGGGTAVATGDINKGLMAGLGAYGGGSLGSGLSAAGTAAGPTSGAVGSPSALVAETAGTQPAAETARLTAANQAAARTAPSTFSEVGQNFSQAGQGIKNLVTGQKGAFTNFIGKAAIQGDEKKGVQAVQATGMGGPMNAARTAAFVATPMLAPKPYTPPKEESTYEGPYTPTPREVRFPTAEQQAQLGTSEFQYFSDVNPVPGFQPYSATQTAQPTTMGLPSTSSTLAMLSDEEKRRMAGLGSIQPFAAAKGGSVPQLESGGFVLTKKAIDGLGKGSNKKGQRVASSGLGAIPIRGKGTGTSDSIKTSIDGRMPARVSNGEAYVPKDKVKRGGGAKKFYALMKKAERAAA